MDKIRDSVNTNVKKDALLQTIFDYFIQIASKKIFDNEAIINVSIGAEFEFYVLSKEELTLESDIIRKLYDDLLRLNNDNNSSLCDTITLEREDGYNQFEIQFKHTGDPLLLANSIIKIRDFLSTRDEVDCSTKPFITEPGNSMHFHVSIYGLGVNLFAKQHIEDEYYASPLYWSIAGLLEFMIETIYIMAPTDNCYDRFLFPEEYQKHIHYPTNCSWGFNNRTCAIRIPQRPNDTQENCRIEYRVCSTQADPFLALIVILTSMSYGIECELDCQEPTFGNAFDHHYDHLKEFPKDIDIAKEDFLNGRFNFLNYLMK